VAEIIEDRDNDTTGNDLFYGFDIDGLLTIPGVDVMRLEVDEAATAYVNVPPIEREPDYDMFAASVVTGNQYRFVITPDDPLLFESNVQMTTFGTDGSYEDLIFNSYGSSMYIEGSIYTDLFVADGTDDMYFSLRMTQSGYYSLYPYEIEGYSIELVLVNSAPVIISDGGLNQGCSVLSFISQSGDVADAAEGVGVAVLAD